MSEGRNRFDPGEPLIAGFAPPDCRACVTIPARNEAKTLSRCLDALAGQVEVCGSPMGADKYEVLLLLNNCTDDSAAVAIAWKSEHPWFPLHVAECDLPPAEAHVGTARRLLMDTAWRRLSRSGAKPTAILATDADSFVARDWIAQNLCALEHGADVVGGVVKIFPEELTTLPRQVRRCYQRDRRYASLVARMEDLLDPRDGDPWPRHLDHFGSSLACTPEAYALAGGMPAVSPLEDEAFIDAVRRANLTLRHEPKVVVSTSARLQGRAVVGLAGQLCLWTNLPHPDAHVVPSAAFLEFRFRFMRRLRQIFTAREVGDLVLPTAWWENTFRDALATHTGCGDFLGAVYCNILIAESFTGPHQESIRQALHELRRRVRALETVRSRTACVRRRESRESAGVGQLWGTLSRSVP